MKPFTLESRNPKIASEIDFPQKKFRKLHMNMTFHRKKNRKLQTKSTFHRKNEKIVCKVYFSQKN